MSHSRDATDIIRGYFYQLDYFMLKLLDTPHDSDIVCVEGIEDVDLNTTDELIAIQCKYYENTVYNHSLLAKPICLMLRHYSENLKKKKHIIKYAIYGHYSSGQHKLQDKPDIEYFKKHFFTYSKHKMHEELKLSDKSLSVFIQNLFIDINAPSYQNQECQIKASLKNIFSCSEAEVEYYYNNAFNQVKIISTRKNEKERKITKKKFLSLIEKKDNLFSIWYAKKRGIDKYCKNIKKQYFSKFNISPYERFFLIDCDIFISDLQLKLLIQNISKNWSKLTQRTKDTFCPYVYLNNISEVRLIKIKEMLQQDNFCFIDGFDFKGADFSTKSICKKATYNNGIKIKLINEIKYLKLILDSLSTTKEIYHFYTDKKYFNNEKYNHVDIYIERTMNINDII